MKIGVEVSIDVTKIEKARLYQGKKGKYLTMTTFIDVGQVDQYGNNGFIAHKKEQDEQNNAPILGNVKVFWSDAPQPQQAQNNYNAPQQQRQQGQSNSQGFKNDGQQFGQQNNNSQARQQTNQAVQNNVNTNGAVDFDDSIPF